VASGNVTYILKILGAASRCVYMKAYVLTYQPLVNELANLVNVGLRFT